MSLKERFYSILIVSATDSFTSALTNLVCETRYRPVHNVTSISAAKRILAEKTFDFIIINSRIIQLSSFEGNGLFSFLPISWVLLNTPL